MKIVDVDNYDFCNLCHLVGMEQGLEVKLILIEETPRVLFCKECITKMHLAAKELQE